MSEPEEPRIPEPTAGGAAPPAGGPPPPAGAPDDPDPSPHAKRKREGDAGDYALKDGLDAADQAARMRPDARIEIHVHGNVGNLNGRHYGPAGVNMGGGAGPDAAPADLPWPQSAFACVADHLTDAAFLGALCLLNGAPKQTIETTAEALRQRLLAHQGDYKPSRRPADLAGLFETCRLESPVVAGSVRDGLPVQTLQFRDESEWIAALRYAWSSYRQIDGWRAALVETLVALGEAQNEETRLRAGRAITALGAAELADLWPAAIERWVDSPSVLPLAAVDAAFAGLGDDPAVLGYLDRRLTAWANGEGGLDGYYAAGRLAGGLFGHAQLDLALKAAGRLYAKAHALPIHQAAVAYAGLVIDALVDTAPDRACKVLRAIEALPPVKSDTRYQTVKDMLLPAIMAARIPPREGGRHHRLVIAVLAEQAPEGAAVLRRLFAAALIRDRTRSGAYALAQWLVRTAVTRDPDAAAIWRLFGDLHGETPEEQRGTLRYNFSAWLNVNSRLQNADITAGRQLVDTW